ncbi:MAG: sigma-70 family RNA polymerase sigma factor [Hyphomicrobiaceae bacterium]
MLSERRPRLAEPVVPVLLRAPSDEAGIVGRLARGETEALGALMDRHLGRLLGLARRMLGDAAEAEDVVQETLLTLWQRAGDIEVPAAGVGAWLRRVTANRCLDRLRARRPASDDGLDRLKVAPRQEQGLQDRDLGHAVEQALQRLPERQRLAITLCHFEERPMAEAGEVLGVSVEAVESLLARARRSLKRDLEGQWRELLPETLGEDEEA